MRQRKRFPPARPRMKLLRGRRDLKHCPRLPVRASEIAAPGWWSKLTGKLAALAGNAPHLRLPVSSREEGCPEDIKAEGPLREPGADHGSPGLCQEIRAGSALSRGGVFEGDARQQERPERRGEAILTLHRSVQGLPRLFRLAGEEARFGLDPSGERGGRPEAVLAEIPFSWQHDLEAPLLRTVDREGPAEEDGIPVVERAHSLGRKHPARRRLLRVPAFQDSPEEGKAGH